VYRSCHVIKICNKFEWNLTIRGWVSALTNIWPKHLAHVPHVAIRSWIIFTKFELGQPIRSWLIMCSVLICYVTLWPWRSTSWPWTFVIHRVSRDQSLYRIWAKKNNLPLSYWLFAKFVPLVFRLFLPFFSGTLKTRDCRNARTEKAAPKSTDGKRETGKCATGNRDNVFMMDS